ncbi:DUF1990 family protein [Streptomyces smyrnaeus]|uniref:DUF1990 family protein n=1 Tax=Streptomyces smyrnaeus TaxID=1387713 RepID=UPI0036BED9CC
MLRERRLHRASAVAALHALSDRKVNYGPLTGNRVPTWDSGWHVDSLCRLLAHEPAGDPVRGGPWEIACRLVRDYQFAEPAILRALYRTDSALLGRDMLLEGRFAGLRFDMGVRVTSVIDETHGSGEAASRVWGWAYRTLQGHLEQGELTYKVVKHLRTGAVEFRISGYSRRAPMANPVVRAGFAVFGRGTQLRFYRARARRLRRLLHAELHGAPPLTAEILPGYDNIALAPTPLPHLSPGT